MQMEPRLAICMHDFVHKSGILRMISVDAFDLKILAALQDDGRLTNQQLADSPACRRRNARGGGCGWRKRR